MTIVKISELPANDPLVGNEIIPMDQYHTTVGATLDALSEFVSGQIIIDSLATAFAKATPFAVTAVTSDTGYRSNFAVQITGVGASTFPAKALTSYLASLDRNRRATSAAPGQPAYITFQFSTEGVARCFRTISAVPQAGGFHVAFVFGADAPATSRMFAGLYIHDPAAFNNDIEPSSVKNCAFFGVDKTDTNVQFMTNDSSGSAAKIDLGVSWASLSLHALRGEISCPQGGASISYRLTDLDIGLVVAEGSTSTDLPSADIDLWPIFGVNTGDTSAIIGINLHKVVVEPNS